MDLALVFRWMHDSPLGVEIRESPFWFPILLAVHIAGLCTLTGSVFLFDLRLLGLVLGQTKVSIAARGILPVVWSGFVVASGSGLLLLTSEAVKAYGNPAFRWKLAIMALAGLNALVFHLGAFRHVSEWDDAANTPWNARVAASLSLICWPAVLLAGRAMAYF